TWSQKANFPGGARYEDTGFSIGNFGYLGTGYTPSPNAQIWKYDPVTDTWTPIADFGGGVRVENVSFSIDSLGYLGTGWDGVNFRYDFWEYHPEDSNSTTGINEFISTSGELQFTIYPNPVKDFLVVSSNSGINEKINMTITDVLGKKVFQTQLSINNQSKVSLKDFSNGIYFAELSTGKEKIVKKFLKE
ncbi:MAG: T9SS type A sorting domain-containing protein, partial [Bacteroidota bacterium]